MRKLALLLACASVVFLCGATQIGLPWPGPGAASSGSNIALVGSAVTCAGSVGAYNCTISSTPANSFITVQEMDDGVLTSTVPTDTNGEIFSACQPTLSAPFLNFWYVNSGSGNTTVTIHSANGDFSQSVVAVWTGVAPSSPLDVCPSASTSNAANARGVSAPVSATQTDLALGTFGADHATTPTDSDNWTSLGTSSVSADTLHAQYIINGVRSPFTSNMSLSSGSQGNSAVAVFKSAGAGSAPSGNLVTAYVAAPSGSNAATLTAAMVNAAGHGSVPNMVNGSPSAQLTINTSCYIDMLTQNTVNGVTYPLGTGTQGICDSLTAAGGVRIDLPATSASLTIAGSVQTPASMPTSDTLSLMTVDGAGAADFAAFSIFGSTGGANAGKILMECTSQDSPSAIVASASTVYRFALTYNAGGTHSMTIYDSSGGSLATVTCPATGTNNASFVTAGQTHASVQAGTVAIGKFAWDVTGHTLTP